MVTFGLIILGLSVIGNALCIREIKLVQKERDYYKRIVIDKELEEDEA